MTQQVVVVITDEKMGRAFMLGQAIGVVIAVVVILAYCVYRWWTNRTSYVLRKYGRGGASAQALAEVRREIGKE